MQQRNTFALPAAYAYVTIGKTIYPLLYCDDTDADLLNDQSAKTDFCAIVRYKTYCDR